MIFSTSRNFIFIHVYKTGGNSLRKVLEPYDRNFSAFHRIKGLFTENPVLRASTLPKHAHASRVRNELGEETYNRQFSFAFVRNPWDWQVSLYHFGKRDKSNHHHDLINSFASFSEYLEWRVSETVKLQKNFLYNEEGQCLVDFIGRFENLQEDFNTICDKIGIERRDLPFLNKGKRKDYKSYYNISSRQMLEKAYAIDIETFKYTFE